jgi:hypothetical protein
MRSLGGINVELDNIEYGLSTKGPAKALLTTEGSSPSYEVLFQPSQFGILDRYSVIKEIYKVQLSPTVISLASHLDTNQVSLGSLQEIKCSELSGEISSGY